MKRYEFNMIDSYVRPGTSEYRYANNGVTAGVHVNDNKKFTGSVHLNINLNEYKNVGEAIAEARHIMSQLDNLRSELRKNHPHR